jgi:hypothetical protein
MIYIMEYFLKSAFIGVIEVLITHPLDHMKTMYQAFDNTRKITFHFNTFVKVFIHDCVL